MRTIRYHEFGSPDVLAVERVRAPTPGPGQALIRTEAIGVNFIETVKRRGAPLFSAPRASALGEGDPGTYAALSPSLPGEPAGDVVGIVESLAGPSPAGVREGDRVAAIVPRSAYSEFVVADARWLVPVPPGIEPEPATVLASTGQVALGVLGQGGLGNGETVLVHAASGAIGHLMVQLARAGGARTVIAGASTTSKLDFARGLGADVSVNTSDDTWPGTVQDQIDGRTVDLVLDSTGGSLLRRSLLVLSPMGRIVSYGTASGPMDEPTISPFDLMFGMHRIAGFSLSELCSHRPDIADRTVSRLVEHVESGRLRPVVYTVLPLAQAGRAHELIESRAQLGRVVLTP